jgi:hypothetical protein
VISDAVEGVVRTLVATVTRPAEPRPSPSPTLVPRPSPGPPPPPPPEDDDGSASSPVDVSDELRAVGRARKIVSGTAKELLDRIPDTPRNQELRAYLKQARRVAEGGMEPIPVTPRGIRARLKDGGPKFSRLGAAISFLTNLAEGDDLGEAAGDTGKAIGCGWMGQFIARWTGPFVIFADIAYGDFCANYDDYAEANRRWDRRNPVLRAQRDRYNRTGYAYRCDQYAAMGFKPQDTTTCEP